VAQRYYAAHIEDGEMRVFLLVAIFTGVATASNAAQSKRDNKIDKGIAWVPLFYNLVPFVLLLGVRLRSQPALVVSVPAYLLFGMVIFCWPFLDNLWNAVSKKIDCGSAVVSKGFDCVSRRLGLAKGPPKPAAPSVGTDPATGE
jgi:hypothetical protein